MILLDFGIDRKTLGIGMDEEDVLSTSGPEGTGGPDDQESAGWFFDYTNTVLIPLSSQVPDPEL